MDVFERVKAIIVENLGVSEDEVVLDASFREDLQADSLDLVELIMAFEEEFGSEISDEDAQRITTVRQAVDYAANKGVRFACETGPESGFFNRNTSSASTRGTSCGISFNVPPSSTRISWVSRPQTASSRPNCARTIFR